jgi:hypothetical protein
MISAWFSGIGLSPFLARSRQTSFGEQSYSTVAQCWVYDDISVEIAIHLGDTGKESCEQAADHIREMYRGHPGLSVSIEEVRQLKIAMGCSQASAALLGMFF